MIAAPHRRRLVHVVPELVVNSIAMHVVDMVICLQEYHHTVLFEGSLEQAELQLVYELMHRGADVQYVCNADSNGAVGYPNRGIVTPEILQSGQYDVAILHSLRGHAGLGQAIPSIYYAYGVYDPASHPTVTVFCSEYAKQIGRLGAYDYAAPADAEVIYPGVPARRLRHITPASTTFTVGLINSGSFLGQFPMSLTRYLISNVPRDITLCVTAPVKVQQELISICTRARPATSLLRVIPSPDRRAMRKLDVLVQGYSNNYNSPYSKTVIEAMAAGIPVVCQRRGYLATQLVDGQHCLFFDKRSEALEHVQFLRQNTETASLLGANGQAWAFSQDQSVYMNQFRSLLRKLGA